MNVIETHGLTKRYRRKLAVNNLDMTVASGDIYGFVGKNGSGKSTTMKMICGLAHPTAGEVILFGDPERGGATPQGFSRIGALIESPGVLASLTARDNLVAKALALGMTHAGDVADDLLGLVGLDPLDHRRVKAYSLGMKQRLGLALALVGGPDLLLLDEPFNGLDPEATRAMRLALVCLNREHGEHLKYAAENVMKDLIPSLDNLELAITYGSRDEACKNLLQGVEMTQKLLLDACAKHGLERVGKEGDVFDPALHEAIGTQSREDLPNDSIACVMQGGYSLQGRLVRPAKVMVNKR